MTAPSDLRISARAACWEGSASVSRLDRVSGPKDAPFAVRYFFERGSIFPGHIFKAQSFEPALRVLVEGERKRAAFEIEFCLVVAERFNLYIFGTHAQLRVALHA